MSDEMGFESAREHLRAWAVRGDERAFEAFHDGWLRRAALRQARWARLSEMETDDLFQELRLVFLNRDKATQLAEAEGWGLWIRALQNRMRDLLRERRRRGRFGPAAVTDELPTEMSDPVALDDTRLSALLSAGAEGKHIDDCVEKLVDGRRRAIAAFTWSRFAQLFTDTDAHDLAVDARRSVSGIREILDASTPFEAPTSVAVFASDEELERRREQCLERYRKARERGFGDVFVLLDGKVLP